MDSASNEDVLKQNYAAGRSLKISGTPTFVIVRSDKEGNGYFIEGEMDEAGLQNLINSL
jgi:protein-disulfide isomerase